MRRIKEFTVEYNYFEPGSKITPTSRRCPLEMGRVYVVEKCIEPRYAVDGCIVFVEGHKYGIDTEYLREATAGEGCRIPSPVLVLRQRGGLNYDQPLRRGVPLPE